MGWLSKLWRILFGPSQPAARVEGPPLPQTLSSTAVSASPQASPGSPRTPSTGLSLEAAAYLPLARDELAEQAARLGRPLWSDPWFGRRDQIPPADDPRTALIDRGMVTQGIATPEELAQMHRVGAEMEKHRLSLEQVQHQGAMAGEAAVQMDRARRAALKEEKRRTAAERRLKHAEEVARRRTSDIVFLGPGVSHRLHQRVSDAARLAALGLPLLAAPADVASALGLSVPRLRWLAYHSEVASRVHYVRFSVPKKSGGTRQLSTPHRTLAAAQRWVFENVLKKVPLQESAHGFVTGRSILSNATPHVGRLVLVNMDLENFFPSITFPRVRSVFEWLGYAPAVATIFALLCTECPRREVRFQDKTFFVATGPRGLPQGACTSPALANLVACRLDRRLHGLARKLALAYTRYADDLTFSGDDRLKERLGYLMARVRHVARDEGFTINAKKTRVLRSSARQMVTGLVVNARPSLPRKEIRRLRAILHRAAREGLAAQNRTADSRFLARLQGKIAFLQMVRPDLAARYGTQLQAILARPD